MEQTAAPELMPAERARLDSEVRAAEFESMVSAYRTKVFRFALASLRDSDAADTITQDCFLRAYRAWPGFRHECSLDTWLMQIAVNLVRDYGRNRRLQFWKRMSLFAKPVETMQDRFLDGECSPETQASLKEQVKAVWDAAARLPERQRTVFLLRFVEEMDLLEIAAATGMKEGTVKTHLFRALQAVRERIGVAR
jgi:RNA polymerase sigma-70 factor (ECF subfamily)